MFKEIILLCLIYSFANLSGVVNGDSRNNKFGKGKTGCGSYFVKEMLHLFSDEKIEGKIQQAIHQLKEAKQDKKIAFTAGIPNFEKYSSGQTLKFTRIITNVGGGLNTTDGVFYCPQPGLYSFFLNIEAFAPSAYAQFHKNGKFMMYVHAGPNNGKTQLKTGSNTIILQLERGDRVSVKSHSSYKFHPETTYFSGHKL